MAEIILQFCQTTLAILGALYAYRSIFVIIGLFATKKFAPAKKQHKYGILVAARNEEAVIGHLLESIQKQTYPQELLTVFVVADNCTDNTAAVARKHGAICYERFDNERKTKGYALQYLFECIKRDYSILDYEAYFLFDADNLLAKNYIEKMNDSFDSGEKIVTSYRNSKNFADNAISASYAFHWIRTARFENRGRSLLRIPVRIQGTGFLFASELVKDGWKYTSLTEDRAFTADSIIQHVHITYNHEAVFYDEQPTSLSVAARQRLRWAKGHMLAFVETTWPLFKNIFGRRSSILSRLASFDMIITNMPGAIPYTILRLLRISMLAISAPLGIFANLLGLLTNHLSGIPTALALVIFEHKRMQKCSFPKLMWLCVTFPIFSLIGDIATWVALFKKIQWEPIPHNAALGIDEMSDMHSEEQNEEIAAGKEEELSEVH